VILHFEMHATTIDNENGLASGWFDADLTPQGEARARAIGVRRPERDLAAVFCSDLRRAWRTAMLAYPNARVPIVRDRRLRECDYGALTRCPAWMIEAYRGKYMDTPFPNGESYQQAAARVAGWLESVAVEHVRHAVLVIGHRATFVAFEHLLGEVPLEVAVMARSRWQPGWTYRPPAGATNTE
jgi:broad specificity phosphatase PhoE